MTLSFNNDSEYVDISDVTEDFEAKKYKDDEIEILVVGLEEGASLPDGVSIAMYTTSDCTGGSVNQTENPFTVSGLDHGLDDYSVIVSSDLETSSCMRIKYFSDQEPQKGSSRQLLLLQAVR